MEGNDQLEVIIPMLKQVGAGIVTEQLGCSTPCASFTVSGVLDHMTGLASAYAPAFRGDPSPTDGGPSAPGDNDLATRFQLAMDALLDAVQSPGALQRTIDNHQLQISKITATLDRQREQMVKQFARLETAIANMQSNLNWLSKIQPIAFPTRK